MARRYGIYLFIGVFWIAETGLARQVGARPREQRQTRTIPVEVKRKPTDRAWKVYETRTLEMLPGFRAGRPVALSRYGGRTDIKSEATGYFYPKKIAGRWWLVDPEGNLFVHVGVVSVSPGKSKVSWGATRKRFETREKWAAFANGLLKEHGFNGTGAWTDTALLRAAPGHGIYTQMWNFMGSFGRAKRLVRQEPGHLGYPSGVIPVFHPEFEPFCEDYARRLAATKDDPYLLGHFSDNEMPISYEMLERSLKLDRSKADLKYGYEAAREWLEKRKGKKAGLKDITEADRKAFLEYALEEYFRVTTGAIRKIDPHHLCLGPRFHGGAMRKEEVFRAAGTYLDVIAVNYYGAWTPDLALMRRWERTSGRPVMITEWYAKGADSGLANNTGAGWLVKTQADRGRFYQNFTLGLLESKVCVGWHWFKYRDNNPLDTSTDPSNRDSNKGIVNYEHTPYEPLVAAMKRLNTEAYRLTDYFDRRPAVADVRVYKDLVYARVGDRALRLDVYVPKGIQGTPPLLVWIHGGAWRAGTKEWAPVRITERGYVLASISYRLSQEAIFPAQIHDCKAAIRWLRAHAKEYGFDPERIGVWGSSAGGHLVALLGTSGGVEELEGKGEHGEQSSRVQAVCDFFGPTDFLQMSAHMLDGAGMDHDAADSPESRLVGGAIQKNKEKVARANPITYVSKDDPSFLIVHGDRDPLVPWHQSELLYTALKQAGVEVTFQTVKGGGHGFGNRPEVHEWVESFFEKELKKKN